MAIAAQGLTFTWGDATLQEIQTLELDNSVEEVTVQLSSRDGNRNVTLLQSTGRLRLSGFSLSGLAATNLRRAKVLTITVRVSPTQILTLYRGVARYESCQTRATANGSILFAFEFRLGGASSQTGTVTNG